MSDLNKQDVQVALAEVLAGLVSDGTAKPRKQSTRRAIPVACGGCGKLAEVASKRWLRWDASGAFEGSGICCFDCAGRPEMNLRPAALAIVAAGMSNPVKAAAAASSGVRTQADASNLALAERPNAPALPAGLAEMVAAASAKSAKAAAPAVMAPAVVAPGGPTGDEPKAGGMQPL